MGEREKLDYPTVPMVEREEGMEGKMSHTPAPFSNDREEKLAYPTVPMCRWSRGRDGGRENWPARLC